ncbi:MAG TPA: NifU family protein [Gammaproteobacteria bacterium]
MEVKDDTVYIRFEGGCQGCAMADVTLRQGVEVMIKEQVPEIVAVVDVTDHAGGTNPYFKTKKGPAYACLGRSANTLARGWTGSTRAPLEAGHVLPGERLPRGRAAARGGDCGGLQPPPGAG